MSVAARNWADRCTTGTKLAKSVLMVLANAAKEKVVLGGRGTAHQCHLGQETIAERTEYSVPSVQRAVRTLNLLGLALSRFRGDGKGYRTASEFFLNVNGEPPEDFAERCGITWRATPRHHSDAKGGGSYPSSKGRLGITGDAASVNRETNRERARTKRRSRSTELPEGWSLPDDWRRSLRSRYEATDAQLDALAKKFAHYYQREAVPRNRRHHDWLARLERWCMGDFAPRQMQQAELSLDHWLTHLRGWRDLGQWHPALGPAPDQPGCRVPQKAFDQLGLRRGRSAA